jgi:Uma2 family endonuclease
MTSLLNDRLRLHLAARTRPFSADEYARLTAAGILAEDERVELLEGEIVAMAPIGSRHAACVNRLTLLFSPLSNSKTVIVAVQNPIRLDDFTEPQPDLSIAHYREDFYAEGHPTPPDILLLVEVSDSTEDYDRSVKLPMYARAGIRETWLIDLPQNRLEAYRQPTPEGYREMRWYSSGETLSPEALPELILSIDDVLPVSA